MRTYCFDELAILDLFSITVLVIFLTYRADDEILCELITCSIETTNDCPLNTDFFTKTFDNVSVVVLHRSVVALL